jgi:hypothetical protein
MLRTFCPFILVLVMIGSGCGRPTPATEDPTGKNLRLVMSAYLEYVSKKKAAPASAKDLAPILTKMGCNPDETMRSERDNEPFVILWKVNDFPEIAARRSKDSVSHLKIFVLGYEKTGKEGRRFVGFSNAFVTEASEADLAKAHFPRNHRFQ